MVLRRWPSFGTGEVLFYLLLSAILAMVLRHTFLETQRHFSEEDLIHHYLLNDTGTLDNLRSGTPHLWIYCDGSEPLCAWEEGVLQATILANRNDFQIHILDDSSFARILPEWAATKLCATKYHGIARAHLRTMALMRILHRFGGLLLPSHFLAARSCRPLYEEATQHGSTCAFLLLPSPDNDHPPIAAASRHNAFVGECVQALEASLDNFSLYTQSAQRSSWWHTFLTTEGLAHARCRLISPAAVLREVSLRRPTELPDTVPLPQRRRVVRLDDWMCAHTPWLRDAPEMHDAYGILFWDADTIRRRRDFAWLVSHHTPLPTLLQRGANEAFIVQYLHAVLLDDDAHS